jgi:hypothetical protein
MAMSARGFDQELFVGDSGRLARATDQARRHLRLELDKFTPKRRSQR